MSWIQDPILSGAKNVKSIVSGQSIQSAIDSITDNAIDNKYSILIYPGTYPENIVMKPYVNLVGVDRDTCIINPSTGIAITFGDSHSDISNLSVIQDLGTLTEASYLIEITDGEHEIYNCYLETKKNDGNFNLNAIHQAGGEIYLRNSKIKYEIYGGTGAVVTQAAIAIAVGSDSFIMKDCTMNIDNTDTNDLVVGFLVAELTSATYKILDSHFFLSNTGTGICTGMYLFAGGEGCIVKNCEWVVNATNDAYGGVLAGAVGAYATTMNNKIKVIAGGSAISGLIGVNDTWLSVGDYIEAAQGPIINGTGIFYVYNLMP